MRSKRCDNAKSKSIYSISHRFLLSVESSKNKKKYIIIKNKNIVFKIIITLSRVICTQKAKIIIFKNKQNFE